MSKERAARRAEREVAARRASADRARRRERARRRTAVASAVTAPFRWVSTRARSLGTWFGRRTRGQRVLVVVGTALVVAAMLRAQSWGTRVLVLGLACLLLPVAWTLVTGRRRSRS